MSSASHRPVGPEEAAEEQPRPDRGRRVAPWRRRSRPAAGVDHDDADRFVDVDDQAALVDSAESSDKILETPAEEDPRPGPRPLRFLLPETAEPSSRAPRPGEASATDDDVVVRKDLADESTDEPLDEPSNEPEHSVEKHAENAGPENPRRFYSKRGSDALAPLALLAALACAATLGLRAYRGTLDEDLSLGIGLTVCAAVLLYVALRVTNSSRIVQLDRQGRLKITVGEHHYDFDLTSESTRIEQSGQPGQEAWRVMILRRSLAPVIIDSRTVDPVSFVAAVRQWRPNL